MTVISIQYLTAAVRVHEVPVATEFDACTCFAAQRELRPPVKGPSPRTTKLALRGNIRTGDFGVNTFDLVGGNLLQLVRISDQ